MKFDARPFGIVLLRGKKGRAGGEELQPESMTREEMREADRRAIEEFGIPGIVLMENAALAVVREVADAASFTVVCAPGNNGGDGLAVARHLLIRGRRVEVFLVGDPERGSADRPINGRDYGLSTAGDHFSD